MPIPKPKPDQSHDEFISECHSALADEYEDNEQRHAVCEQAWRDRETSMHESLLKAVKGREGGGEYGYGITTADKYVSRMATELRDLPSSKLFTPTPAVIEKAATKLVFAHPKLVVEKSATDAFENVLPEGVIAPPNTLMVFRHIVTTPREDRDKDVLHTKGAKLDPKAPLLWQHLYTEPIGKILAVVEHSDKVLKVVTALLDLNELTDRIAKLIAADALRFSHGFRALEWNERKDEGEPDDMLPTGFDVTSFEIMEVSLVSVASNIDANVELWTRGGKSKQSKFVPGVELKRTELLTGPNLKTTLVMPKHFTVDTEYLEPSTIKYDWASRYLGIPVKEMVVVGTHCPNVRLGSFLTGLANYLDPWELHDTRNLTRNGKEVPPQHEVIELDSMKTNTFLVDGTQFWKCQDRRIVLDIDRHRSGLSITVYARSAKEGNEVVDETWDWAHKNNFLRGEAFSLTGSFLKRRGQDWDDVILEQGSIKSLKSAVKHINDKAQMCASRGMILMGPPGTGKTLSGRVMLNQAKATFIWIAARDFYNMGAINGLCSGFDLAKELAPSVLFIEDIDSWLSDYAMDVIKTEMDGVDQHSGVMTVLTMNYPERLPEALIDRPGRFHDVLHFKLPNEHLRKQMLQMWSEGVSDAELDELVTETKGYSGAHLYELCSFAKTLAAEDDLELVKALRAALEKIESQRELINQTQAAGGNYPPRQRSKGVTEMCVEELMSREKFSSKEKSGRSLSAATLNTLKDIRDDLSELMETELKRAQKALLERCHSKLGQVIEKAEPAEEEEKQVEVIVEQRELTTEQLMCRVRLLDEEQLRRVRANINSVLYVSEQNLLAKQYRELIKPAPRGHTPT